MFAIGTIWGVALVTVAALLLRRFRLAIALAGAGVLAWLVAWRTGVIVARTASAPRRDGLLHGARLGRYPIVHLAVIGAVVLAAAPFLSRPLRRTGNVLLVLLVLGALGPRPRSRRTRCSPDSSSRGAARRRCAS